MQILFRIIRIFLLLLGEVWLIESAFCQKQTSIWYFGNRAGLDFRTGVPIPLTNGALNTLEGCATICDKNGQLLFYTDGVTIWNRNHQVMVNGTGLRGSPTTTQTLIVPQPGSDRYFYVFIAEPNAGFLPPSPAAFCYSIVDLSLHGGLGEVTVKNTVLFSPSTERITAVHHQNGNDIWVIARQWNSKAFYTYLLTGGGLSTSPAISYVGQTQTGDLGYSQGYLKAAPDGRHLAMAVTESRSVELFDFDNATGNISNAVILQPFPDPSGRTYGVEFSPDGSKLYCAIRSLNKIFQYDLQAGDVSQIAASLTLVGKSASSITSITALQLAPDGKIYVGKIEKILGVINDPNASGTACEYTEEAVDLGGRWCYQGLPGFVQSYLYCLESTPAKTGPITGPQTICKGQQNVTYSVAPVTRANRYNWILPDGVLPVSGSNITLSGTISLQFDKSFTGGIIRVKGANGCYAGTASPALTIKVDSIPEVGLGKDRVICDQNEYILTAPANATSYQWQDGSSDATFKAVQSGEYWVRATNACGSAVDTIRLAFVSTPVKGILGPDRIVCNQTNDWITPGAGYSSYRWQNGSQESALRVSQSGSYWVEVNNPCGTVKDTVHIQFENTPRLNLGNDLITLCQSEPIVLNAGSGFRNYQWQDGSTNSTFQVNQSGTYAVTVTNNCGSFTDEIEVTLLSSNDLFIPNVITPNGDGKNDFFVLSEHLIGAKLKIMNRWGKVVFESPAYQNDFSGQDLRGEVYFYWIMHNCLQSPIKGILTIF